jgi:hypothetical protein
MNWIKHFNTMVMILVSADVASICVSAMFFSERVRRWTSSERWGSHPSASTLSYSVAVAGMDDLSIRSIRPQPIGSLRNPFEVRTREALAGKTTTLAYREESRRPTFRRSSVLQQRIAAYETALAGLGMAAPERQNETRIAILPSADETPNPCFERFSIRHLQEAHPFQVLEV